MKRAILSTAMLVILAAPALADEPVDEWGLPPTLQEPASGTWYACGLRAPERTRFVAVEDPAKAPADAGAAKEGGGDLLKSAQNPIANLISVPIQLNSSQGIGPHDRGAMVVNVQPVVPVKVGRWLLVNRVILPIVGVPDVTSEDRAWRGLGDTTWSVFVVPPSKGKLTWGVGPIFNIPMLSDPPTGTGEWGAGVTGVALVTAGKWVVGALANNVWGIEDTSKLDKFLFQYFVNYNLPNGWYVVTAPIITADWNKSGDDRWVIPFGGGIGKLIKIGPQPVNVAAQVYYNAIRPDGGADWSFRLQAQLLFPAK